MTSTEQRNTSLRRIRAVGPEAAGRLSTEELRSAFLAQDLFMRDHLTLVQSEIDRMILGGARPDRPIALPSLPELGGSYFLDRREVGIVNTGPAGVVRVGSERFTLETLECLYIGTGETEVWLEPLDGSVPRFFLVACPAGTKHPTAKVSRSETTAIPLGNPSNATQRTIYQYIHLGGVQSSQLMMGFTELAEASVWNTTPPHLHERRSEIYLYDGLSDTDVVIHLMGQPGKTRHLIVRNGEAVLSPPWSIHMGAGSSTYRFIWAMAGENKDFEDMDPVALSTLR